MDWIKFNEMIKNKEEWLKYILNLKEKITVTHKKEDEFAEKLAESFINVIKTFPEEYSILFSGGMDSTLISFISKKLNKNFECITVGFEDSEDLRYAKEISSYFGFKHKIIILNEERLLDTLNEVKRELVNDDVVSISIGIVEYLGIKNSMKFIATGLGSEEIFAGYERHSNSKDINHECWNGLINMFYDRDIKRILSLNKDKILMLPFLHEDIIRIGMSIPSELKIKEINLDKETIKFKKYILALTCYYLGIPKNFAFRKKKAAQYGSSVMKYLKKIAKRKGFKYLNDFIKKQW